MGTHILVADGSATVRKFVAASLAMLGYEVTTAQDGMDALEKLSARPVDLVITALNMRNVDGFAFIKSLREVEAYRNVPIIILTSLSRPADIRRALALGATSYLHKPFDPARMAEEIEKCLN